MMIEFVPLLALIDRRSGLVKEANRRCIVRTILTLQGSTHENWNYQNRCQKSPSFGGNLVN